MKKLLLLLMCTLGVHINAQTYTMSYTDYKVFDSVKNNTTFEIKKKTNVMIDYNVNIIVVSTDSTQKFFTIRNNFKVDEDVFFDCTDRDNNSYKLSMITTPTHYIFVENSGNKTTACRMLRN